MATEPLYLRPYTILEYICVFKSKNDILYYIERVWKERRNILRNNGMHYIKAWDWCGYKFISELNEDNFGVKSTDLVLVCLFND